MFVAFQLQVHIVCHRISYEVHALPSSLLRKLSLLLIKLIGLFKYRWLNASWAPVVATVLEPHT